MINVAWHIKGYYYDLVAFAVNKKVIPAIRGYVFNYIPVRRIQDYSIAVRQGVHRQINSR